MRQTEERQRLLARFLDTLPPLPQVVTRALALLRDPDVTRERVTEVLALDPALAGHFLRVVNSAYYGLPRRIVSLDQAIGLLGFKAAEEMLLAMSAVTILAQEVPAYTLGRESLWLHSVAVAEGARFVAESRDVGLPSEAYLAGLMHDVGKLAADVLLAHSDKWPQGENAEKEPWTALEQELLGMDHAQLGSVIVRVWNLPDLVVEAVGCHHQPTSAVIAPMLASAVHIADTAALMAGLGLGVDGMRYPLDGEALARLAWQETDMETLVGAMTAAVEKARAILSAVT